jgi:hypothetical protein
LAVDVPHLMDNAARCPQDAWTTPLGLPTRSTATTTTTQSFPYCQGKRTRQAEELNMSMVRFQTPPKPVKLLALLLDSPLI